ncbi:hypothetical protein NDU88_007733 [Pleurodeles waltl]|uniref:Uncharacterized protein n=1 Tax=Pleurodeles waltl TaxID=8319 RepID=A0AAV7P1N0_PLEWA|nr:hypothetical protein NDU88_007733 [Pleurodeles waltl]
MVSSHWATGRPCLSRFYATLAPMGLFFLWRLPGIHSPGPRPPPLRPGHRPRRPPQSRGERDPRQPGLPPTHRRSRVSAPGLSGALVTALSQCIRIKTLRYFQGPRQGATIHTAILITGSGGPQRDPGTAASRSLTPQGL